MRDWNIRKSEEDRKFQQSVRKESKVDWIIAESNAGLYLFK